MCKATISVITPCYNGARFLRDTIESVLRQTCPPVEVIVVDDGSTDRSPAVAESFGPPVRVIRQRNQGESTARNRGLSEACGEWIAFIDADDIWMPTKLESQLAVAADGIVAVHTNLFFFGAESGVTTLESVPAQDRYSLKNLAIGNNFVTPSALLVRRSASPTFPTWTRYGEDLVYCLDLVQKGEVRLVPEALTGYRKHSGGQSAKRTALVDWHLTVERWMQESVIIDAEFKETVREKWLQHLAAIAWQLKADRKWNDYWRVRHHLARYRGHPAVESVLRNCVFPPWVYRMRDTILGPDRLLASHLS